MLKKLEFTFGITLLNLCTCFFINTIQGNPNAMYNSLIMSMGCFLGCFASHIHYMPNKKAKNQKESKKAT